MYDKAKNLKPRVSGSTCFGFFNFFNGACISNNLINVSLCYLYSSDELEAGLVSRLDEERSEFYTTKISETSLFSIRRYNSSTRSRCNRISSS